MTMKSPLVSVIMNCYNGETYLREAIDSIYAQTYQNWEIIFLDNASTDGFPKEAESSRQEQDSKLSSHVPAQGSGSHRFGLVHSCENPRSRPAAIACTPTAPRCGLRSPSLQPDLVLSFVAPNRSGDIDVGPWDGAFDKFLEE